MAENQTEQTTENATSSENITYTDEINPENRVVDD